MTSKRPASNKRAAPPRTCDGTKTFLKGWERLSRSGRQDLRRPMEEMLLLIASAAPPGTKWLDHALKSHWADHRECHIGGDFLLIYPLDGNAIISVRAGTHSELLEECVMPARVGRELDDTVTPPDQGSGACREHDTRAKLAGRATVPSCGPPND